MQFRELFFALGLIGCGAAEPQASGSAGAGHAVEGAGAGAGASGEAGSAAAPGGGRQAPAASGSNAAAGRIGSAGVGSGGNAGGAAGRAGASASAGNGGSAGGGGAAGNAGTGGAAAIEERFSFFVTSVGAMRKLSDNDQGFGGDLRFGKQTGLEGADEICRQTAELALPGSGAKGWRAFLSATRGGANDGPIHAKDRVGEGPWYDRLGRLVAANKADLLQERPRGADPAIIDDLPNENGIPNHRDGAEGCTDDCPDNHQILTGTNSEGMLKSTDPGTTCNDWTNAEPEGMPWCGHSWPREVSGVNWMSSAADGGCAPCVSLIEMGGVRAPCVGSAGGYGGIYCFALKP